MTIVNTILQASDLVACSQISNSTKPDGVVNTASMSVIQYIIDRTNARVVANEMTKEYMNVRGTTTDALTTSSTR
jgi:hypothetical protein